MVRKKAVKRRRVIPKPRLGAALLCDNVNVTDGGKIDAQGIITIFWAWGYPCTRTWFLVLTLFQMRRGKASITISLKKGGQRDQTSLKVVDASVDKDDAIITLPVQLNHPFEAPGRYELVCAVKGSDKTLRIPFVVLQKEWVQFSGQEKEYIENHPETPHTLRANVHCRDCGHAYIFEESVIDDIPAGGIHRFPSDGQFECDECGYVLNLKDLQGQLRSSLKDMLEKTMRSKL